MQYFLLCLRSAITLYCINMHFQSVIGIRLFILHVQIVNVSMYIFLKIFVLPNSDNNFVICSFVILSRGLTLKVAKGWDKRPDVGASKKWAIVIIENKCVVYNN